MLQGMYLLKEQIGGFSATEYWSSKFNNIDSDRHYSYYYYIHFNNGYSSWRSSYGEKYNVRAVRTITQ